MSGPITWRQLAAPNMADAARPMEYARQSLNAGFEGLQRTLDFYNQSYKENQDKDQALKSLAVQELLQTARTPEEVAALQPQLQSLTAAITDPKYRKEVLGAQDSRAAFLRDALVKDWQYQDQNQARENRPITNTIQTHIANGNYDAARYVAGAYADRLNNSGDIALDIRDAGRKDLEWGEKRQGWQRAANAETRAQAEESRRVLMHPYAVTQAQLNNENSYAGLQKTISEMAQGKTPSIANLERLASIQRDGESRLGSMDDRISSPAVQEKLFKTIKERFGGDKDTAEKVISQVRGLVSNPAYKDLRFDDAVRLATGTNTSTAWYRPGNGQRLASEVDAFMQTPEYGARGVELSTNMAKAGEALRQELAAATAALGQEARPGVGYQPLDPRFSNLATPQPGNGNYQDYRRKLESGGNPTAKSPTSSAYGIDQFTDKTWRDIVTQTKPAWANGMSDEQIQAQRANPQRSAEMAAALDSQHAVALTNAKQPVNNHNLYASHHFGMDKGVEFAKANPNTPMSAILTESQMAANPYLRGMTKEQAIANWDRRAGVTSTQGAAVAQSPSPIDLPKPTPVAATPARAPAPEATKESPKDFVPTEAQLAKHAVELLKMGNGELRKFSPEAQQVEDYLRKNETVVKKKEAEAAMTNSEQQRMLSRSKELASNSGFAKDPALKLLEEAALAAQTKKR